jgi:hypothetical protein
VRLSPPPSSSPSSVVRVGTGWCATRQAGVGPLSSPALVHLRAPSAALPPTSNVDAALILVDRLRRCLR